MSQEEILNALKKKEMTQKEIQNVTKLCRASLYHALKQLIKYNEIFKEYMDDGEPIYTRKKKKKRGFSPHLKNK